MPTLALLNAFKQEYHNLCAEEDLIPLAEFNSLLSAQIKDQPAPYLFERLGTFYQHFLIDEFPGHFTAAMDQPLASDCPSAGRS